MALRVWLAIAFLAAYFGAMAWPGLLSGLGDDDLMNMTFAFRDGWAKILKGNLLFFSTVTTRPLGSLFYLAGYEWFGPVSLPLRIVGIASLAVNLTLLYRLARALTGRSEAGLLAALFLVWHGNLAPLFFGSGNIYDVFAFFFYYAALGYYVSIRQSGATLTGRQLALLGVFQICALNSKEFTATLPGLLLIYELLFHWPVKYKSGVTLSILLSGAYTLGKLTGANALVQQDAYRPSLSLDAYLNACGVFLNDLTYTTDIGTPKAVALFLAIVLLPPLFLRSRTLAFAAALGLLGTLPVMLIPPRGLASHYVAMGGLALWLAILIVKLRDRLGSLLAADERERQHMQTATFALAALFCLKTHAPEIAFQTESYTKDSAPIAQTQAVFREHPEWFAKGSRILVVSDPFRNGWAPVFLAILHAHDMNVVIHRLADMNPQPNQDSRREYTVHLHWENHRFVNRPL